MNDVLSLYVAITFVLAVDVIGFGIFCEPIPVLLGISVVIGCVTVYVIAFVETDEYVPL